MDVQDLIKKLMGDNASQWTETLKDKAGFSAEEAQGFVPAALEKVTDLFKGGDFDFDVQSMLGKLDAGGLASKLGLDVGKATDGLKALVPDVLGSVQEKFGGADGLKDLLGGGEKGGLLGGVASKLFGKK